MLIGVPAGSCIDGLSMLDCDMRYSPKYGLIQDWFMYTKGTSFISLY